MNNFRVWCDVSPLLKLQPDNICIIAVNNALEDELDHKTDDDDAEGSSAQGWNLCQTHGDLSGKVLACINAISDIQKAASSAHFFVSKLPGGKDKVLAAQGSKWIADQWLKTSLEKEDEEDEAAMQASLLAENNLLRLRMEDALHRHGLWSEDCAEILTQKSPAELVMSLFEHLSIVARNACRGGKLSRRGYRGRGHLRSGGPGLGQDQIRPDRSLATRSSLFRFFGGLG